MSLIHHNGKMGGAREGAGRKGRGRPPGPVSELLKSNAHEIEQGLEAVLPWKTLLEEAHAKGDSRLCFDIKKYWKDRAEGKPAEQVQLQGPGGGVVKVHIVRGA